MFGIETGLRSGSAGAHRALRAALHTAITANDLKLKTHAYGVNLWI